jgi:protein-S-isoprenylcysteine O-methyltransferase Ste14
MDTTIERGPDRHVTSLIVQAFAGLAFLIAVLAAALFAPPWTFDFWQAWLFLAVFATAVTAITIDLAVRDPALLARRVKAGPIAEPSRRQKLIQAVASLSFVAIFLISALDHRGGWSRVPAAAVVAGDVLVAAGLAIVFLVFRANTFTSAVIEVEREQALVSTGPYAVIRHPMYAGAFVMLIGAPIALGSWVGLLAVPPLVAVIVWRLLDEEKLLAIELPGYAAYRERVTRRLVPWIW